MSAEILYSKRKDGNMSFTYGEKEETDHHMKKWFQKVGIPFENTLLIQAQDGTQVMELTEEYFNEYSDLSSQKICSDGIITKKKGVFCYLKFGDCIPCLIYDQKQEIMAFIHLGRQSIINNLHLKTLKRLLEHYHSKVEDLVITIGPCIKKESYLWDQNCYSIFQGLENYIEKVGNTYQVDLLGYVLEGFHKMSCNNIMVDSIDTGNDDTMFSNAKDKNTKRNGRFICGAWMKEGK